MGEIFFQMARLPLHFDRATQCSDMPAAFNTSDSLILKEPVSYKLTLSNETKILLKQFS